MSFGLPIRDHSSKSSSETLNEIADAVDSRFEETNPVFKHMEIFDTRQSPLEGVQVAAGEVFDEKGDTPAAAFVNDFGNESIEPLARHYSQLVVQLKSQILLGELVEVPEEEELEVLGERLVYLGELELAMVLWSW